MIEPTEEQIENVARNFVPENNAGAGCGDALNLLSLADRVALVRAGCALVGSAPRYAQLVPQMWEFFPGSVRSRDGLTITHGLADDDGWRVSDFGRPDAGNPNDWRRATDAEVDQIERNVLRVRK